MWRKVRANRSGGWALLGGRRGGEGRRLPKPRCASRWPKLLSTTRCRCCGWKHLANGWVKSYKFKHEALQRQKPAISRNPDIDIYNTIIVHWMVFQAEKWGTRHFDGVNSNSMLLSKTWPRVLSYMATLELWSNKSDPIRWLTPYSKFRWQLGLCAQYSPRSFDCMGE